MENIDYEKELVFRRFPEDKQEQIRQLVAYCSLMGLTGRDLVSIGNKLIRIDTRREIDQCIEIAKGYESSIVPAGKTADDKKRNLGVRWVYTDQSGNKWEFTTHSMFSINVKSRTSNVTKHFYLDNYFPVGRSSIDRDKICIYNALIALHRGEIKLNF